MPTRSERAKPLSSTPAAGSGVLLVGHGTRSEAGVAEFLSVADQVAARRPTAIVEPCFLELAAPTIAAGLARAVERGARRLVVMPLVLFAAGHAKRDIPRAVAEAAAHYPKLKVRHARHLGCQESIVELSATRYREALSQAPPVDDADTLLVLVGRGSYDRSAEREMVRFSRLRFERHPVGRLETCFAALTHPTLDELLPVVAGLPYRRIVVEPHLVFQGEILERVTSTVAEWAGSDAEREWLVTAHLGPHRLLADAIVASLLQVGTEAA